MQARANWCCSPSVAELRRLAARPVRVFFAEDVPVPPGLAIPGLPGGGEVIESGPRSWSLKVEGPLGPLLRAIATLPVQDIEVGEAKLEDAILEYYRDGSASAIRRAATSALGKDEECRAVVRRTRSNACELLVITTGLLLAALQLVLIFVAGSIQSTGGFEQLSALLPPFARELLGPSVASFLSFSGIVCLGYFQFAVMGALIAVAVTLATTPASEVESGLHGLDSGATLGPALDYYPNHRTDDSGTWPFCWR